MRPRPPIRGRLPPRFYVESLGCAKNQVDSELMIAALSASGYRPAATADEADLIIVNSCGFIAPAKAESIDTTLEMRSRYPGATIILAGCLSQRYEDELRAQMPEIDGFAGNRDPDAVIRVARSLVPPGGEHTRVRRSGASSRRKLLSPRGSAYVKISEGCDNRCTYCAIPLIRGDLRSRSPRDIVAEVRGLRRRGIREINLVAQDVGSYGRDLGGTDLVDLLERVLAVEGDYWLRLLYIHPDHFATGILALTRADNRLVPYFDLPFQHASPGILRAMGRRGDAPAYLKLLSRIRRHTPHAVIRSTFLTGFPGETEADFRALLAFQAAAAPDWMGAFPYSREEGTAAAGLKPQVSRAVAERRRRDLERAQIPITERSLDRHLGAALPVLLEERIPGERMYLGRCYAQAPEVDGCVVVNVPQDRKLPTPGRFVTVRIGRRNGFDLEGTLV